MQVRGKSLYDSKNNSKRSSLLLGISVKELALISVFSALWVATQDALGPVIGAITGQHGVVQRLFGWFLMLILAELTEKFGRTTLMATIAALATRIIRRSASLYIWFVALGYSLGGLVFDLLFFIPFLRGSRRGGKAKRAYVLMASLISGIFASVPYLVFQFYTLDIYVFTTRLPIYAYDMVRSVALNVLGTFLGTSIAPKIKNAILKSRYERTEK